MPKEVLLFEKNGQQGLRCVTGVFISISPIVNTLSLFGIEIQIRSNSVH